MYMCVRVCVLAQSILENIYAQYFYSNNDI